MWTNAGARPGDRLLLTKPIGTGVVATAIKFGRASEQVASAAIASMTQLNREAAEALAALPSGVVHACTDITGFGLAGHASEMGRASGCVLAIDVDAVPLLPGSLDLVERNTPGGGRTNQAHFSAGIDIARQNSDSRRIQLMFDPQTSGGLLVAVAPAAANEAIDALTRAGVPAQPVGEVVEPVLAGANLAVILR
jgi:selenide,water dikinase